MNNLRQAAERMLEVMHRQGYVGVDEWIAAEKAIRAALAEQPTEQKKDLMWSTVAMQKRHDERIGRIVNTLEQIKQEQLAEQPASLDWVSLNKAADEIVRSKPTWKRFIDGTPLANDIACWMADFALEHTTPQTRREVELTDEEIDRALDAANVPELPAGYESVELEIARAVIEAYKAKQEKT